MVDVGLDVPSGKRLHNYGKIHQVEWVNPLFLWPFSIAMLNYQRVSKLDEYRAIYNSGAHGVGVIVRTCHRKIQKTRWFFILLGYVGQKDG